MENQATTAHVKTPWSRVDEKNWVANRKVLRDLAKRGEEPSDWLATEHGNLDARRKTWKAEELRVNQEKEIRAHAEKAVAAMPELSPEQCRRVARVLHNSGVLR